MSGGADLTDAEVKAAVDYLVGKSNKRSSASDIRERLASSFFDSMRCNAMHLTTSLQVARTVLRVQG